MMEREEDVFRATFGQRGRDISLGLMVLHPMSRLLPWKNPVPQDMEGKDDNAGQQEQAQEQAGAETEGESGEGVGGLRRWGKPRPV